MLICCTLTGFCDGSATAAVEEYLRRFSMRRIPDRRVFSKVFNTSRECGTLPSAHVSSERARQHVEEQENILEMAQRSPTTSTRRLSARLGVSQTRVWRTLHEDGLYPFHPQRVQNLHPGDIAMRIEFCHWLHTNRQLLPLILFTDEATFTRNAINNTTSMVSRQSTWYCGNKFSTLFLYQCLVRYDRRHVDWSRYFRRSYDRIKLPRLSAKWITRTTIGCCFGYKDCYVLSAWRSHFS